MQNGITFDTGALIALERRSRRMGQVIQRAHERRIRIVTPADAVAEWWRGRTDLRQDILSFLVIEPLSEKIAKMAGEALASVRGATTIDAIVVATAALRGDVVFTTDVEDLQRLQIRFPGVRILAV